MSSSLKELYLDYNNVGSEGAKYIADALKLNTTLKELYLSGNNVDSEGAKYIADALILNSSLKELYLNHNNVGSEGAKYIADALKLNSSLKELYLDYNNIGSKGAKYIADLIKSNDTLTAIYLAGNSLGLEANSITDSLKFNKVLTTVNLRNNKIKDYQIKEITDSLKLNKFITSFDLSGNPIKNQGGEHIFMLLNSNKTLADFFVECTKIGKYLLDDIKNRVIKNKNFVKETAIFLIKKFINKEEVSVTDEVKYFRYYQAIDKSFLQQYLLELIEKKNDTSIFNEQNIQNYIAENFMRLAAIAKSAEINKKKNKTLKKLQQATSPFLVPELSKKIIEYLGDKKSLWEIDLFKKTKKDESHTQEYQPIFTDDFDSLLSSSDEESDLPSLCNPLLYYTEYIE